MLAWPTSSPQMTRMFGRWPDGAAGLLRLSHLNAARRSHRRSGGHRCAGEKNLPSTECLILRF